MSDRYRNPPNKIMQPKIQPHLVVPVGTQVITRIEIRTGSGRVLEPKGSVAEIQRSPDDRSRSYALKFASGETVTLKREDFSIRKQKQKEDLAEAEQVTDELEEFELDNCIIYKCIVGSVAYGLNTESSDLDQRGIYIAPAKRHWSLYGIPEQIEKKATDEVYWELQKFLLLALKANPNILECLYTPVVKEANQLSTELLSIRESFLSKLVFVTYNGYAISQFKKLEQDLRNNGEIRWKHAMHLIRLLLSGITVLKEGYIPVRIDNYREMLLAIRNNEIPWAEVDNLRQHLNQEFETAYASTKLPDKPDYYKVNAFLVKARQQMALKAN